eukprot:3414613-Pyramimonas_sp.AAC.1
MGDAGMRQHGNSGGVCSFYARPCSMRRDITSPQPAARAPLPKCVAIRRKISPVLKYSAHIATPMPALGARPRATAT